MKTVSLREFRRNAGRFIAQVHKGERIVLSRRGKPVARLEPIKADAIGADDPIYSFTDLAVSGQSLNNSRIDEIVYGN